MAHPGENCCRVLLDLLPHAASIPKLAASELMIDELHVNRHLCGQAGDKRQQRLSMRFTRGIKAKHPCSSLARTCVYSIQKKWKANSVAAAARSVQRPTIR